MAQLKKILLKGLQIVKKLFFLLLTLILLYVALALLLSFLPTHPSNQSCSHEYEIFITSNGVHLDIILPVENIGQNLRSKLRIPAGTHYVSFGWGDKEFYIKTPEWSDLTFPVAFRALFQKSESAMHVTWYRRSYSSWKKVVLCRHQNQTLNRYIEHSFKTTTNGKFAKLSFPGYTDYDQFYEAKGSFSIFQTCNTWTNRALKEIEVKTSVWSPFDFGVLHHLPDSSSQQLQP